MLWITHTLHVNMHLHNIPNTCNVIFFQIDLNGGCSLQFILQIYDISIDL